MCFFLTYYFRVFLFCFWRTASVACHHCSVSTPTFTSLRFYCFLCCLSLFLWCSLSLSLMTCLPLPITSLCGPSWWFPQFFLYSSHTYKHTLASACQEQRAEGVTSMQLTNLHTIDSGATHKHTHTRTTDDSSWELPNTRSRRFLCTFAASKDRANLIHNLNFDNFHLSNASFSPTLLFQSTGDANPLAWLSLEFLNYPPPSISAKLYFHT